MGEKPLLINEEIPLKKELDRKISKQNNSKEATKQHDTEQEEAKLEASHDFSELSEKEEKKHKEMEMEVKKVKAKNQVKVKEKFDGNLRDTQPITVTKKKKNKTISSSSSSEDNEISQDVIDQYKDSDMLESIDN